ncbi:MULTISPECIES: hypothetical protein [Providencia]|uniref:Uncharacterized protein n=1 Tax=Providencia rettgeri TaxID=587 RepID=A0AAJ6FQN4_PRORE|nr:MULTISPECIES: hypothetical protein [Providencia]WHT81648.1 hypothetical protein KOL65_20935 [Providencia rettgeri]WHT95732.1 hypothetical protein KOF27_21175 [Providencia rettgeri]WJM88383.1 hypothetical protein KOL64_20515 [Providencia rettgeri]
MNKTMKSDELTQFLADIEQAVRRYVGEDVDIAMSISSRGEVPEKSLTITIGQLSELDFHFKSTRQD